jgi:hypothetical protein
MATAYPGGLRKRGGLLDYEDTIQATPRNPFLGGVADLLGQAYKLPEMPRMGVPGLDFMAANRNRLMDMLGVGDVQKTAEALSYGFPVGTGKGMTYRPKEETINAAMALAPFAGKAIRATEGLPVGASIKPIGNKNISVKLNEPSNFLSAKSEFGEVGGTIRPPDQFSDKPYLQINYAEVEKASRGKGKGKELYQSLIDDAQARGLRVFSDSAVEKQAVNVYKSLEKSGYKLKDMTTGKLEDGAVYGAGAANPAFEISSAQSMSPYPQAEAMRLAQQRAALPVEQGGLGLLENNTAMDRAKAMGGKDMVHFSRAGGDYTRLDSGKFAIAPFDAVGTHVGTPGAAMERFQNTTGYKVNNPNYANDELKGVTYPVTILGDRPMMNQNGMPFGEDDLNALLRQQGGHNWSDIQGGKMTYQDMNAGLRKKLFEDQGYTSIPYYNEVEGKGSVSYIVPPENIRSRFAAFDPFRRTAATAAAMGVAAPDLLAAEMQEELKRLQAGGLLAP